MRFSIWEESLLICVIVKSFVNGRNQFPLCTEKQVDGK
jgi:hypothetical protein